MQKHRDFVDADYVKRLLEYDPDTGIFRWRVGRSNIRAAGSIAGCYSGPYASIKIDGIAYQMHRLAYLVMTGCWPVELIDHIDGDKHNNAWRNIRAATAAQNVLNTRRRSDNTSGHKGVFFVKRTGLWIAKFKIKGVEHYIGQFPSFEEAKKAYCESAPIRVGEFFNDGHGGTAIPSAA